MANWDFSEDTDAKTDYHDSIDTLLNEDDDENPFWLDDMPELNFDHFTADDNNGKFDNYLNYDGHEIIYDEQETVYDDEKVTNTDDDDYYSFDYDDYDYEYDDDDMDYYLDYLMEKNNPDEK